MDSVCEHGQNMVKVDPHACWNGATDDGVKVDPLGCWVGAGVSGDEELDNMLGSILDFSDFPMESLEEDGLVNDWDASKSQYLGPIPMDVLMGTPTIADSKLDVGTSIFMHRPVSLMDTKPETKQQTYRLEGDAAGSCILQQNKSAETARFQSRSPVSVLENSSSSLAEKSLHLHPHVAKRTRSKRPPPSGETPWLLLSPFFGSRTCDAKITKDRRKKSPPSSDYSEPAAATPPRHIKKCTHCEITKTPQWREGPLGPKTLCNACGVRYRSGRLFPEYRPAASPTFVPSLHSNSHKKVIEMRNKGKHQVSKVEQQPSMSMSPQLEFIPASSYLFDSIC